MSSAMSMSLIGSVMGRAGAELHLKRLTPGSLEYTLLQRALLAGSSIAEIALPEGTYKIHLTKDDHKLLGGFGSSEHVKIGDSVKLREINGHVLNVGGTTKVTFGEVIALAGDFYGVVGAPISLGGGSDQVKTERFQAAFNTLYQGDPGQLKRILDELKDECKRLLE